MDGIIFFAAISFMFLLFFFVFTILISYEVISKEMKYLTIFLGFLFVIIGLLCVHDFILKPEPPSLTSEYTTYKEKYYEIIEETSKTAKNIDNYETCVSNTQVPQLCDDIKNDITSILKTDPVKEKLEDNNCFPEKKCNIDRYDQSLKDLQEKQASLKASIERYDRIKDIPND